MQGEAESIRRLPTEDYDAIPLVVYAGNVGVTNNGKLIALKCSKAGCLAA